MLLAYIPVMVTNVTIIPAKATPIAISGMALLGGIPNVHAAKEPVHAPVIGKGTATNITRSTAP